MDPVAICNIGLGLIGANLIETINEDDASSTEEELCSGLFEMLAKKALEEKAWLFATGFMDLGAIAATPAGEVERADLPNRYKLPANTVAVRAVDDGSGTYQTKFERADQYVLVGNASSSGMAPVSCSAIITKYIPDPLRWSATFCMALAYKIASLCAVPLTHNAKLMALYEEEYKKEIKQAAIFDGMQGTTNQVARVQSSSLAGRR